VTRTIWLASYPKSGNTWMRALLGNILAKDSASVGLDALVHGYAGDRNCFDLVMLVDSGLLTHDEIDCLRPRAYKAIADGDYDDCFVNCRAKLVRFVKTHDAYWITPTGEPLLGGSAAACGAIIIVRDPRDVALSFAHHLGAGIGEAIAIMSDDGASSTFFATTNGQEIQFRQKLLSWSNHVASWLNKIDVPMHLVRYEDLRKDTAGTLRRALAFAGLHATEEKIDQAVGSCEFAQLREQEVQKGFLEAPRPGEKFFRRGEAGGWRDELSEEQILRIESDHGRMMRRLGYELSTISAAAHAGKREVP
jgi:aryl sulfotransferase